MTILEALEVVISKLGSIAVPVSMDNVSGPIRDAIRDLIEIHKAITDGAEKEETEQETTEEPAEETAEE